MSDASLVVLPSVDVASGRSLRLPIVRGDVSSETLYGSPLDAALVFQEQGATWVHVVDLDAAFGRGDNHELITEVIGRLDIPVQISGGLDVSEMGLSARSWTTDAGELQEMLRRLDRQGCARYVVTDVRREGTLAGPNVDLLNGLCDAADRAVIARGGIGSLEDLQALASLVGVEGAIVGKAFYTGAFTLSEALAAIR